jgi:predicted Zn-dependent peptidase
MLGLAFKEATLEVSFRTPAYSDETPTTVALEMIREIYFGGTSDLYRTLVEREGLVESIGASSAPWCAA